MTKAERQKIHDAILLLMATDEDWQHGMNLLASLVNQASRSEVRCALVRVRRLRKMTAEERLKEEGYRR